MASVKMDYMTAREQRKGLELQINQLGFDLRDGKLTEDTYQTKLKSLELKLTPITAICEQYEQSFAREKAATDVIKESKQAKEMNDLFNDVAKQATSQEPYETGIVSVAPQGSRTEELVSRLTEAGFRVVNLNTCILVSAYRNLDAIAEAVKGLSSGNAAMVIRAVLVRNRSVHLSEKVTKKQRELLEPIGHMLTLNGMLVFTAYTS